VERGIAVLESFPLGNSYVQEQEKMLFEASRSVVDQLGEPVTFGIPPKALGNHPTV